MKYSERGRIRSAIVGDVVIITRGETALAIPAVELGDLLAALQHLAAAIAPTSAASAPEAPAQVMPAPKQASRPTTPAAPAAEEPAAPAPKEPTAPAPAEPAPVVVAKPAAVVVAKPAAVVVAPAPAPAPALQAATVSTDEPAEESLSSARAKPGQMWAAVVEFLATKTRPQGFATILDAVLAAGYPGDAERPLRIGLAHRTSSGDLIKTDAGRYRLAAAPAVGVESVRPSAPPEPVPVPVPTPVVPEPTPQPVAAAAPRAPKPRPGNLWLEISEYLASRPRGVKVEELVTLAGERGWTTAANVEHAVHASLTRIGPSRVVVSDKGIAKLVK